MGRFGVELDQKNVLVFNGVMEPGCLFICNFLWDSTNFRIFPVRNTDLITTIMDNGSRFVFL